MRLRSGLGCLRASAPAALKAALALFIIVVALQVRGASASDSVSTYADREASAVLVSSEDGLYTSVDIVVADSERTTAAGVERHLNASIEILQSDSKRPNAQQIDVAGGVFAGGVNLTPDGSSYAALSAFGETSTVTCS